MLGSAPDLGASGISGQIRCPIFTCIQLASGDSPVRNCQCPFVVGKTIVNSLHGSEGSCRKEPVAVVVLAAVDECSEKLGGGLGRQNLEEKLVVKARRVPERLGHDNHQDFVALP